jgi:hypothetical protein
LPATTGLKEGWKPQVKRPRQIQIYAMAPDWGIVAILVNAKLASTSRPKDDSAKYFQQT